MQQLYKQCIESNRNSIKFSLLAWTWSVIKSSQAKLLQGGFLTSYMSYCSYVVRAMRIVLILFLALFCLLVNYCKWYQRQPRASAMPQRFSNSTNISGVEYMKGQGGQQGAIYGQLSIAATQGFIERFYSSIRVTGAEQLQEKPQYIHKLQDALQVTSRRNLREQNKASRG